MNIGVAYADMQRQFWLRLEVPDNRTVREAIERSGILERVPGLDLSRQKVGIYGKLTQLDAPLQEHDRVEIYRAILIDPASLESDDEDDD
jgi:putative ubiquitin-RnfH superfamily antitoxin RatB of RatAB toxin-antitoxin module